MSDDAINKAWRRAAMLIGENVYRTVNTPDTVGGEHETGYILMFFNAKNHNGKSTLVSSNTNTPELKKLLKEALRNIDGPRTTIIDPEDFSKGRE